MGPPTYSSDQCRLNEPNGRGILPNEITYAAVIFACCFCQMGVKALQLFEAVHVQGFQPVGIIFTE